MLRLSRKFKALEYSSLTLKQDLIESKNLYFNAIKAEKLKHQNLFLEKEDTQSIFKAMSYTKDYSSQTIPSLFDRETSSYKSTFYKKCNTFRSVLFLLPPYSTLTDLSEYHTSKGQKQPKLSHIELESTCTSKIKGKTFRPDLIT